MLLGNFADVVGVVVVAVVVVVAAVVDFIVVVVAAIVDNVIALLSFSSTFISKRNLSDEFSTSPTVRY